MAADLRLRDVTEDDLPIFFEHQLDPEANLIGGFEPRARDAFVAHWRRQLADETVVKRTVLVDGRVAGNVVSFEREGVREVGYWIGREHWGKGIATGALSAFLDLVSERPLYAGVAKTNLASVRVLEKSGFVVEREEPAFAEVGGQTIEGLILRLDQGCAPGGAGAE